MQRMFLKILAIALLIVPFAYAQSLGDVARENREKKAEDASSAAAKVITNKDLPKDPETSEDAADPVREDDVASVKPVVHPLSEKRAAEQRAAHRAVQRSMQKRLAEQRSAEQWTRQIVAQENRVAALQARVDQLNASLRTTYGNVQYEAPYSRSQGRQLERIAQTQQQLDEQKMKLADMQEAARRGGMHTVVYDP